MIRRLLNIKGLLGFVVIATAVMAHVPITAYAGECDQFSETLPLTFDTCRAQTRCDRCCDTLFPGETSTYMCSTNAYYTCISGFCIPDEYGHYNNFSSCQEDCGTGGGGAGGGCITIEDNCYGMDLCCGVPSGGGGTGGGGGETGGGGGSGSTGIGCPGGQTKCSEVVPAGSASKITGWKCPLNLPPITSLSVDCVLEIDGDKVTWEFSKMGQIWSTLDLVTSMSAMETATAKVIVTEVSTALRNVGANAIGSCAGVACLTSIKLSLRGIENQIMLIRGVSTRAGKIGDAYDHTMVIFKDAVGDWLVATWTGVYPYTKAGLDEIMTRGKFVLTDTWFLDLGDYVKWMADHKKIILSSDAAAEEVYQQALKKAAQ